MSKKKILVGGLSLAIVGISCLAIGSKPTYKVVDNSNLDERMAVYIKNDTGNYEKSNSIPTTGYMLNEEKSRCNNNAKPTWNRNNKSLKINNLSNDNTSCYLYFDEETEIVNTVLGNLTINRYTPDFSQIATTDEGIFKAEDNDGTSYYWRGATTTNYLKFAGYCWRIVRINGDGTVRLIYDGTTCHANGTNTAESIAVQSVAYNEKYNQSNYVGWTYTEGLQRPENNNEGTPSNAKIELEKWYNEHLKSHESKIANGKFCNDRDARSDDTWTINGSTFNYAAIERTITNNEAILKWSSEDVYILNIGLITADELMYAGGKYQDNKVYYLYNGQNYWTMSPVGWDGEAWMFFVREDGCLDGGRLYYNVGLRPVINLRSDITISSGNGTIDNPYAVEGA